MYAAMAMPLPVDDLNNPGDMRGGKEFQDVLL
jgi:hypothetical protein